MTVRNYRDLILWQKAMDLVELVYRITTRFPQDELYGLAAKSEGPQYPFRPTSPKAKGGTPPETSCGFSR